VDPLQTTPEILNTDVARIAIALALGLFLGLEREWSRVEAGIRTFGLTSVLGAIFTFYDEARCAEAAACPPALALVGAGFVALLAGALMARGLREEEEGLRLTTAVSLLVAYGVGGLVARGLVLPATVVTVASALLLVFKRELHGFAWGLSRDELRSTAEFAILAFVVYPLLPGETVRLGQGSLSVTVEPRVVWLMVVFVAGIGIVNYAVVATYGGRGVAVSGFFGGLASSTAVVGTMLDHAGEQTDSPGYAVAAVLLADAAMAVRNLAIVLVFTLPDPLLVAAPPLLAVVAASVGLAAVTADWGTDVEFDLETPFSLRNALGFGVLFLAVVVAGGLAKAAFGHLGFYVTAAFTGLVSSAGAATTAVVLLRTGELDQGAAVVAVMIATLASVAVKAALALSSPNRAFARRVALLSAGVTAAGVAAALAVLGGIGL
jgi:uncharacterized membrane protein (DUF4010 family)